MKKLVTSLAALSLCAVFAAPASAVVLMSESFSYVDGALDIVSGPNWSIHSGTTDITVAAGRAVAKMANSADDNRTFPAQPLTSPTYACFEATVADSGASPKAVYFAHFKDTGTTNFPARVYVLPVAGGPGFTFGISYGSTSATTVGAVPWSVGSLSYGTPYYLVVKYDPAALIAQLWVNPVNAGSTNISQTGTGAVAVSAYALRQSSTAAGQPPASVPSGSANFSVSVDNLGVGTSFDESCFQVTDRKSVV